MHVRGIRPSKQLAGTCLSTGKQGASAATLSCKCNTTLVLSPLISLQLVVAILAQDTRIDFAFSNAAFDFAFLPFKVPYPVPFKLLGDETKGFIDVTYLAPDGGFRLSRGNKARAPIQDMPASLCTRLGPQRPPGDRGAVAAVMCTLLALPAP